MLVAPSLASAQQPSARAFIEAIYKPYLEKAYQQWPELPLLDQLSLLHIELSQPEPALMLLSNSLPWHGKAQLQQELTMRLLNLLHLAPTERQQAILSQLDDSPWYREQRAELWRLNQRCDKAISLLNPAPEQVRSWRTLPPPSVCCIARAASVNSVWM